jgi:hypothetical protein
MPNLSFLFITLLSVAIGFLLIPFVLGPLLVRLTLKQASSPEVGAFNPDKRRLPQAVADFFDDVRDALAPLGFETVDGLTLPHQTPNVNCVALMLANRKTRDTALATVLNAKDMMGLGSLKSSHVEFVTRFRDGDVVQTNNSSVLSAFRSPPHVSTTQFPTVRDAERLYRLHQALVRQHGEMQGKILRIDEEFKGDAPEYLARAIVEELENQVTTGFLYHDAGKDAFCATWKGALLMTWSLCWPFSAFRKWRRARKAQRLLAELEN